MGFSKITEGFSSLISQIEAQLSLNEISPDRLGPGGNRFTGNEKKSSNSTNGPLGKKKILQVMRTFKK